MSVSLEAAPAHAGEDVTGTNADLHIHTSCSDGQATPEAVVDYVRRRTRLNLIAITDHNTIEGALRAAEYSARLTDALDVIIGEEVSSRDGHVLGLFLDRRIPPGMSVKATVEAILEQGGLAIAAHPFWSTERRNRSGPVYGVGRKAVTAGFDAIEVENATPGLYFANRRAHRLRNEMALPSLGGSDAHILDAIGRAFTSFPGVGEAALRQAIASGQTRVHRRRYRPTGLARYGAFWLYQVRNGWSGYGDQ